MKGLRVAIVYDCFYPADRGGGERVYRAIADELSARGAVVDYVTRRTTDESDRDFRVVEVWDGAVHDRDGTRSPRAALAFAFGVARHFVRHRRAYDVVIASGLPVTTLLAAVAALFGSRTRVVADWLEVWTLREWWRYSGRVTGSIAAILQAMGARSATVNTVNSAFTESRLRRMTSSPVHVLDLLALGGEPAEMVPADLPSRGIVVARLIEDKQIHVLPAAVRLVRKSFKDFVVDIVGDGQYRERIEEAIAAEGVPDAVLLHGRVEDRDLERMRAPAAVHILPSRREGFGLVVAEAAARGVPSVVVEGDGNAAAELVVNGVNGFRATSAEPADLARAIAEVLSAATPLRIRTAEWYRSRSGQSFGASVADVIDLALSRRPTTRNRD